MMKTEKSNTAHSLYALYETLPDTVQHAFLEELLEKRQEQIEDLALYLACRQAKTENEFLSDHETLDFIKSLPQ
jgi:hypothetical protein